MLSDGAMDAPDIWLDVILGVSVRIRLHWNQWTD